MLPLPPPPPLRSAARLLLLLRHAAPRPTPRIPNTALPNRTLAAAAAAAAAAGSPTSVRVEESKEGGSPYAVTARSGRHTLRGDLMPAAGGGDAGPSPKEYVLMALGSCTAMTMRIYGQNMIAAGKWPGRTIRRIGVECKEYGKDKHLPSHIRVRVSLDSDLDAEQTQRLLAAAGKCPVKRILKGELKEGITTELVG